MNKPIIVEKYADNGEHSHWSLVDCETSELLWSEAAEEEIQQVKLCNKPAVIKLVCPICNKIDIEKCIYRGDKCSVCIK